MVKNIISIQSAIEKAISLLKRKNIESPRLTAEILISHVLSLSITDLYLKRDNLISDDEFRKFWELIIARSKRFPIQYLTQEVDFLGLKLKIKEDVFIPRPETEILTLKAISILKNMFINKNIYNNRNIKANKKIRKNNHLTSSNEKKLLVLDIGTGCGAIGLAIAKNIPGCFVYATDISKKALKVAKTNAFNLNLSDRIKFFKGYLFEPLPSNLKLRFDLIISNPPYVPISKFKELQPEIRKYEPKVALLGGEDGLFYYREIISNSLNFLRKDGHLLLEIGYNQSKKIEKIVKDIKSKSQFFFKNQRYKIKEIIKDLSKIDRVVVIQKME
jgi:release factor glutamine methyltransferase